MTEHINTDWKVGHFEQMSDTAWACGVHSQLVRDYAALGDIAGLRYSIKCLIACTKATAGTMRDLLAHIEGVEEPLKITQS